MLLSIDVNLLSTVNGTQCAPQAAGSIMAAAPSLGTAVLCFDETDETEAL